MSKSRPRLDTTVDKLHSLMREDRAQAPPRLDDAFAQWLPVALSLVKQRMQHAARLGNTNVELSWRSISEHLMFYQGFPVYFTPSPAEEDVFVECVKDADPRLRCFRRKVAGPKGEYDRVDGIDISWPRVPKTDDTAGIAITSL